MDPETAETKFDELSLSMIPVAADGEGPGTVMQKFDPNVEEVVWVPRITGG